MELIIWAQSYLEKAIMVIGVLFVFIFIMLFAECDKYLDNFFKKKGQFNND